MLVLYSKCLQRDANTAEKLVLLVYVGKIFLVDTIAILMKCHYVRTVPFESLADLSIFNYNLAKNSLILFFCENQIQCGSIYFYYLIYIFSSQVQFIEYIMLKLVNFNYL